MNKLEKLFRKKAVGVDITIQPDSSFLFHVVVLERKKEELEIRGTFEANAILSLKNSLNKGLPVIVSLNGKGIIGREVNNSQLNEQEIIGQLLPGASLNDFYLVKRELADKKAWVSIVRKEVFDKLINELLNESFFIPEVTIGPVLNDTAANISGETNISTPHFDYSYQGGKLQSIQPGSGDGEDGIRAGEDVVSGKFINAFSLAFGYLIGFENNGLKTPEIEQSSSEFWHKNVFYYGGITALVAFFCILLMNFFFFDHYRNQLSQLQNSAELKKSEYGRLSELQAKVKEKTDFISSTGLEEGSKTSFYADRIAATVPQSISLKMLDLNPLASKIKSDEQIMFRQKNIIINGACIRSTELNEWIKSLKEFEWVKRIELKDYKGINSSGGDFKLEIVLL